MVVYAQNSDFHYLKVVDKSNINYKDLLNKFIYTFLSYLNLSKQLIIFYVVFQMNLVSFFSRLRIIL